MNNYLEQDEKMSSFIAVKSFLQSKKYNLQHCMIECKVNIAPGHTYNDFEFDCIDHIPNYILNSSSLKSIGYHAPFWSAYNLIKWDENKEELTFSANNTDFKIKHK